MRIRFYALLVFVLLPFLLEAQNSLTNKQTLVIATYQYGDNPRILNIEPFARHFAEAVEIKTVVKSYPSVSLLLLAMNKGEVDVAFINTFGYLMLKEQTSAFEISAALHLPDDSASHYKSVIVTPRTNRIKSLEDGVERASDNMLILVSPGSTSGNLIPRLKLASMMDGDPEMFFLEVQYAERHDVALQNMLTEQFALAAFGSEEYYKLGADTVKVNKLWESSAIPLGPVVCKKELSENIKISLKKALLELHEQNPEALESIKSGWTEAISTDRFMTIDDSYYEGLIKLAGNRDRAMRIIRKFAK
jgi:phosphonate transport system substrate-binding protein